MIILVEDGTKVAEGETLAYDRVEGQGKDI